MIRSIASIPLKRVSVSSETRASLTHCSKRARRSAAVAVDAVGVDDGGAVAAVVVDPWQHKSLVLVTFVRGSVVGLKIEVKSAVPLTSLKLEILLLLAQLEIVLVPVLLLPRLFAWFPVQLIV